MREGWNYVSLGQCCDVLNGLWKGKKEPFVHVGVIRNANFTKEFTLDFSNVEYLDVEERQYTKRKLRKGDLIVEKSGGSEKWPVGRAVLFLKEGGEFSFSNFTSVLRIKDSVNISPKYLYIYLFYVYMRGDTRNMQKATTGIHNIEFEKYLSIQIPLPPLSEQQRIVDYLDKTFAEIDALKAKAAEEVANAKAMFDAALKEEMTPKEGWEEKTLSQVCEIQSGYAFKSNSFRPEGQYQIIRMGNVRPGVLRLEENPVFGDFDDEKIISKAKLNLGDIIITQTGTRHKRDYGFTAIIDSINLMLNQRLARLRVNSCASNTFILYYTWTDLFRNQFFANEGGAVGQGNVGIDAIKNSIIPLPSFPTQQSIVTRLDSLRSLLTELEQKYTKIAAECDALKQAILRETFE